jgi:hypothetical protein
MASHFERVSPLTVKTLSVSVRQSDANLFRILAALALVAAMVIPVGTVEHGPTMCPFRLVTGLPCPGCGLTRSWVYLMHGQLGQSLYYHPLGPISLIAALLFVLGVHKRFPAVWQWVQSPAVLKAIAAVWLIVWVMRVGTFRP